MLQLFIQYNKQYSKIFIFNNIESFFSYINSGLVYAIITSD